MSGKNPKKKQEPGGMVHGTKRTLTGGGESNSCLYQAVAYWYLSHGQPDGY